VRRRLVRQNIVVALVAILAAGLAPASAASTHKARWTLLYYVDADTDQEAESLEHIEHMAEVGSTKDVNVVVLVDRNANDNTHDYGSDGPAVDGPLLNVGQFNDAKLLKVEKGKLTVIQELGEIDMGSAQTFSWFLATGMRRFPAEHYAVVIDDHGGGITGAAWDDSTPVPAGGRESHLSVTDITAAISAAFKATGVKKVDLVGFDACWMANVDVALKLAPFADYLVASEALTNGRQWRDDAVVRTAVDNAKATGADLARAVAKNQSGPLAARAGTMSVVDLHKVGGVKQALAAFSKAILAGGFPALGSLGRARSASLDFGFVSTEADAGLYDVGDLVAHLRGVPAPVTTAGNALYQAVKQATVTIVNGPLAKPATGLSIIFPPTKDGFGVDYKTFAAVTGWADVLAAFYGTTVVPKFQSQAATLGYSAQGVTASADLTADSAPGVVSAEMAAGMAQGDGSTRFFVHSPAAIDSGAANRVVGVWNYTYIQLSGSASRLDASTYLRPLAVGLRASIPLLYQTPTHAQIHGALQFTLDAEGNAVDFDLVAIEPDGATTALPLVAGALVAPLVHVVNAAGESSLTLISHDAIDVTDLGVTFFTPNQGRPFVMAVTAVNAAGDKVTASAQGTVAGA
jgi:type II secretory pathway pseudopilin PulG